MLKVQTTKLGSLAVLCVDGKIIRGETDALRSAVLSQLDTSVVVLDLAHVNTIDAGGLGVMLELREETESRGIEFRLAHVTQLVRRILELTKLDSVFKMSEKELPGAAMSTCLDKIWELTAIRLPTVRATEPSPRFGVD